MYNNPRGPTLWSFNIIQVGKQYFIYLNRRDIFLGGEGFPLVWSHTKLRASTSIFSGIDSTQRQGEIKGPAKISLSELRGYLGAHHLIDVKRGDPKNSMALEGRNACLFQLWGFFFASSRQFSGVHPIRDTLPETNIAPDNC